MGTDPKREPGTDPEPSKGMNRGLSPRGLPRFCADNLHVQSIDTLLCAAHVIPVEPRGALADHAVAVDAGRIVGVLPSAPARARFEARAVLALEPHAIITGLATLH